MDAYKWKSNLEEVCSHPTSRSGTIRPLGYLIYNGLHLFYLYIVNIDFKPTIVHADRDAE